MHALHPSPLSFSQPPQPKQLFPSLPRLPPSLSYTSFSVHKPRIGHARTAARWELSRFEFRGFAARRANHISAQGRAQRRPGDDRNRKVLRPVRARQQGMAGRRLAPFQGLRGVVAVFPGRRCALPRADVLRPSGAAISAKFPSLPRLPPRGLV